MERVKVIAGSFQVGGIYDGKKILSLGQSWVEKVAEDDLCIYHSKYTSFQYAYLGEKVSGFVPELFYDAEKAAWVKDGIANHTFFYILYEL